MEASARAEDFRGLEEEQARVHGERREATLEMIQTRHQGQDPEGWRARIEGYDARLAELRAEAKEMVTEVRGTASNDVNYVFPSYIIIEMELDDETWHVVRECPGVSRFVGSDASKPDALRDLELIRDSLISHGDADTAKEYARKAGQELDKAASKGVLHPNQAANRKSAIDAQAAQLG